MNVLAINIALFVLSLMLAEHGGSFIVSLACFNAGMSATLFYLIMVYKSEDRWP